MSDDVTWHGLFLCFSDSRGMTPSEKTVLVSGEFDERGLLDPPEMIMADLAHKAFFGDIDEVIWEQFLEEAKSMQQATAGGYFCRAEGWNGAIIRDIPGDPARAMNLIAAFIESQPNTW